MFLLTTASSGQSLTQKWFEIQFQVFKQRIFEIESVFSVSISWPETFFWNENNSFSISRIFFSRFFRISKLLLRMNMTLRLRHTTKSKNVRKSLCRRRKMPENLFQSEIFWHFLTHLRIFSLRRQLSDMFKSISGEFHSRPLSQGSIFWYFWTFLRTFWQEGQFSQFKFVEFSFQDFFRISKLLFRMNMTLRLRHTTFRYVSDL